MSAVYRIEQFSKQVYKIRSDLRNGVPKTLAMGHHSANLKVNLQKLLHIMEDDSVASVFARLYLCLELILLSISDRIGGKPWHLFRTTFGSLQF